jgi:hypothetical protein
MIVLAYSKNRTVFGEDQHQANLAHVMSCRTALFSRAELMRVLAQLCNSEGIKQTSNTDDYNEKTGELLPGLCPRPTI